MYYDRPYYNHRPYHYYNPYWNHYSHWYWRTPYYPWSYSSIDDDDYYFWAKYNR